MPELQDVTNPPANPPATPPAEPPAAAPDPVQVRDTEALEIGKLLLESGYTKDQINSLMDGPRALEALRYAVENDPEEFIRTIERNNPGAGENFLDKLSKLYVNRYDRGTPDPKQNGGKADANGELMAEFRKLQEEVGTFRTQAQAQAQAAAMAQVQARFQARLDDLFGQLPADKFPLSTWEKGSIRKSVMADIASDPSAFKRMTNGNFVDVPRTFQGIVESLAADRKTAAEAEKKARDASSKSSFPNLEGGPAELPKDFYTPPESNNTDDIWDVSGLVKALEATGGR